MPRVIAALCLLFALSGSLGCTRVFYRPDHAPHSSPRALGFDVREFVFPSVDGTQLAGWFLSAQTKGEPLGTIVQFHGNSQNLSRHYASLAWLTRRGYNLFTFDYRGYGQSEGEPAPKGVYQDGMAALDTAWQMRSGRRFVVIGQSLGGAIAMRAFADFRHRSETQLVVLDSTFPSYKQIAREVVSRHWYTQMLAPFTSFLISDEFAPVDSLRRNSTRLLVIHDRRDPVVPYDDGKLLYQLAAGPKEFWTLDTAQHVQAFAPDKVSNRERFVHLLDSL